MGNCLPCNKRETPGLLISNKTCPHCIRRFNTVRGKNKHITKCSYNNITDSSLSTNIYTKDNIYSMQYTSEL